MVHAAVAQILPDEWKLVPANSSLIVELQTRIGGNEAASSKAVAVEPLQCEGRPVIQADMIVQRRILVAGQ